MTWDKPSEVKVWLLDPPRSRSGNQGAMNDSYKLIALMLSAVSLGCTSPVAVSEQQWFLMARHGECIEVEELKRKVPDLADIKDPYSFITFMRQKGHTVTSSEMTEVKGTAIEVNVPEKDLFLVFVTAKLCQKL